METVREYLNRTIAESSDRRYHKLIEINAPQIVITNQNEITQMARNGKIKFTGNNEALDLTFKSIERKVGRGGKSWLRIETEEGKTLNYFPVARYGRYIKFED